MEPLQCAHAGACCTHQGSCVSKPTSSSNALLQACWDGLSDFTLEFGSALLLNLVLRSAGKARCDVLAAPLLELCEALLQHPAPQVRDAACRLSSALLCASYAWVPSDGLRQRLVG